MGKGIVRPPSRITWGNFRGERAAVLTPRRRGTATVRALACAPATATDSSPRRRLRRRLGGGWVGGGGRGGAETSARHRIGSIVRPITGTTVRGLPAPAAARTDSPAGRPAGRRDQRPTSAAAAEAEPEPEAEEAASHWNTPGGSLAASALV